MNELILPFNEIQQELQKMQDFLEITMSEEASEAVQRGNDLAVYMARSGKLVADAKYHRDHKLRSETVSQLKEIIKLPPSVAVKFIDSLMEEENRIFTWTERINRTCTHQLEWCRTVISKAKEEMRNFNFGNQPY
ncbi:MAG: hypothetical protein LBT29_00415 [Flavobacteriaceae bacterium]|nr:hypothetical protein [Flavobacteriaceae bacterium]